MSEFSSGADALPEPLRARVALAWSEFRERSGTAFEALPPAIAESLPRVWAASPFSAGQCLRRPEILLGLADSGRLLRADGPGEIHELLRGALEGISGETALMAALRRFRNREMVRIAWRDIASWAPLKEMVKEMGLERNGERKERNGVRHDILY